MRAPDHRPFLITGSGRCGTGYTAQLLAALGYECGHEVVFDWPTVMNGTWPQHFQARRCDSSWLGVPFIEQLPEDTIVFHQVRNPVAVIRSLKGISFLTPEARRTDPYAALAAAAIDLPEDELLADMTFWLRWNLTIQQSCGRRVHALYRIEDLDAPTVQEMVNLIDPERGITVEEIDAVMRSMDGQYNARPRDEAVRWETLPDCPLKEQVLRLAEAYGYSEEELRAA